MSSNPSVLHHEFLSILPRIKGIAHVAFRTLPRSEREEAIAETVAHAWAAFVRLIQRGKNPMLFPSMLARYSILAIKAGKLVGRENNRRDLFSPFRKKPNDFQVVSLEVASGENKPAWKDVLSESRHATPADIAASRIDVSGWLRLQNQRNRRIAVALAEGNGPSEVAKKFKLSPARISQIREEFRQSWAAFHGEIETEFRQMELTLA